MKKMFVVTAIALGLTLADRAGAESNGIDGMLLGAGGGALVGQAIGRNTKGTLIGAAVGTVVGYAIGNEMDKGRSRRATGYSYQPPLVERRRVVVRPESLESCREAEMLATIDGRAEKVYGRACLQDGVWVGVTEEEWPQPVVYETVVFIDHDHRHKHHRHGHHREGHGWRERDDQDDNRPGRERLVSYRRER